MDGFHHRYCEGRRSFCHDGVRCSRGTCSHVLLTCILGQETVERVLGRQGNPMKWHGMKMELGRGGGGRRATDGRH